MEKLQSLFRTAKTAKIIKYNLLIIKYIHKSPLKKCMIPIKSPLKKCIFAVETRLKKCHVKKKD